MEKKSSQRKPTLSLKEKGILKHVLSPLEQAVMRSKSNPFIYNVEGIDVYISRYSSKQLLLTVQQKLELIFAAHEKDQLSPGIPIKLRETFDDPQIVLSLHPLLRKRLCKLECYSLFTIMQRGRKYFTEDQNFRKQNMKTLDDLFSKYKCGDLF